MINGPEAVEESKQLKVEQFKLRKCICQETDQLYHEEAGMLKQKNLDDELNKPVHENLLISDKSCLFYNIQTLTKLKYFM